MESKRERICVLLERSRNLMLHPKSRFHLITSIHFYRHKRSYFAFDKYG